METMSKIKYFVYCRKSTEGEERQALSIESQRDKALEFFSDLEVVEVLEERSSAFIPNNRPIFSQMIERIKAGEARGIIAWHPDRLSRCEIEAATITYMIRTGQIRDLKFGSYNFDNSPEGIWMLQMALSQSQYSSAKLSKDVKRGLEKKVKMGWCPYVAPVGYLNDKTREKGDRQVIIDPDRYSLVRKMWDLMLTGHHTPPKIAEMADQEWGFRTLKRKKLGGGPISRSGLYAIFTNPFYAGILVFNGKEYQGSHPPMVTLEEFDRVQKLLGRKGKPRPKTHEFAFTAALKCEECGCFYTAETKTKYIQSTGEVRSYTYYHCTRKSPKIKCTQRKNIRQEKIESLIDSELAGLTILPEFRSWAIEALNGMNDREIDDRSKIYEMKHKALEETQAQLDNLTRMRYRDLIDDDEFSKERTRLKSEINRLKEEVGDVEQRAEKWLELTEQVFDFATYARVRFMNGDLQTKKEILLTLGQNPSVKNGQIKIEPNEWFVPITENYAKLEAEYRRLEPALKDTVTGLDEAQSAAFTALRTQWLARWDDFRTLNWLELVEFPDHLSLTASQLLTR